VIPPGAPRIHLADDGGGLARPAAAVLERAGFEVVLGREADVAADLGRTPADAVVALCSTPASRPADVVAAARDGDGAPVVVVASEAGGAAADAAIAVGAGARLAAERLADLPRVLAGVLARRGGPQAGDRLTGLLQATRAFAIWTADAEGRITEWGGGAQTIFGYAAEEVVGAADLTLGLDARELDVLTASSDAPSALDALLEDARRHGGSAGRDWTGVRRDGSRVAIALTIAPIAGAAGGVRGFVALARDVSRRREFEDLQAALHRVAAATAGDTGPESVFGTVAREAALLIGGDVAGVSRLEGEVALEAGSWARSGVAAVPTGSSLRLDGTSAVAAAARSGRPQLARDAGAGAGGDGAVDPAGRPRFPCVIACPIRAGGRIWGALWVGADDPGCFGEGDAERLLRFAEVTGIAVANFEARDRIVLDTVARIFRGDTDVSGTLDLIASTARRAMAADRATCYVHGEDGSEVVAVHTTESDPARRAFLERSRGMSRQRMPILQLLMDQAEPYMIIEDLADDPAVPDAIAGRLDSGALIGLRLEHPSVRRGGEPDLLGTLFLSFRRRRRFSARERTAAESLAGMAAMALANARLHATTVRTAAEAAARAAVDPLTGLPNHRAFQERLSQEVTRARRHGRSLSLALIDIDRFRRVNEQHGHEVGDRVLRTIAGQLMSAARDTDLVARVGGEEIAWLMPETEAMEAWQAVDRAREALARTPMDTVGRVTASAGVCDLAQAGSAGELLRLAEGALYWAKQHGRDVAFLYSPKVVEELSAEERADRLQRLQALQSIRVLARAVDAKDSSTREHSERVADLAVAIATNMGWDSERLVRLREAGLVHDVGKIGVPDRILFKPDRLTPAEYDEIKNHAPIGAEMVADVLTEEQVAWVRGHHERWDGRGYPDGLAAQAIPDGARVLALADSWDVMTSLRPYHEPLATEEALAECRRCAGTQFCPTVIEALEALVAAGAVHSA
jgi:diguanylate cyclase (GGDEF)-like protein/PAS domain S-box-containing protein/putative nucleotidyltransferase with HDIG domain